MCIHSKFEITENVYSQQMCVHRKCALTEVCIHSKFEFTASAHRQNVSIDKAHRMQVCRHVHLQNTDSTNTSVSELVQYRMYTSWNTVMHHSENMCNTKQAHHEMHHSHSICSTEHIMKYRHHSQNMCSTEHVHSEYFTEQIHHRKHIHRVCITDCVHSEYMSYSVAFHRMHAAKDYSLFTEQAYCMTCVPFTNKPTEYRISIVYE